MSLPPVYEKQRIKAPTIPDKQNESCHPPVFDSDTEWEYDALPSKYTFRDLLQEIGLADKFPEKLNLYEVNKIFDDTDFEDSLKSLPLQFIGKVTALDARSVLPETYSLKGQALRWSMRDFLFSVFVCCDEFLRQKVIKHLAQCCLAVPVLLPYIKNFNTTAILLGLRTIVKKWKPIDDLQMAIEKPVATQSILTVGFVRFGKVSESKSGIINVLLGRAHGNKEHYFFLTQKEDPVQPLFSKGTIEASWLLPIKQLQSRGSHQITTVLNLRGNAEDFKPQLSFLCKTVNVLVVFADHNLKEKIYKEQVPYLAENVEKFYIVLLDSTKRMSKVKQDRNWIKANVVNSNYVELGIALGQVISDYSLECKCKKKLYSCESFPQKFISTDENNSLKSKALNQITKIFDGNTKQLTVAQFNEQHFPLLKIWQQWVHVDKGKLQSEQITEKYIDDKYTQKKEIRKKQISTKLSTKVQLLFTSLSAGLKQQDNNKSMLYLITFLQFQISDMLEHSIESTLRHIRELENKEDKPNKASHNADATALQKYCNNVSFGLEHFIREIGQWYEANFDQQKSSYKDDVLLDELPEIATRLLLMGYPLEVLDGDTAHVPITWINAVLNTLKEELNDPKIFVISVIGMQSSGKSTLLNSMFGAQFAVRAGRCTKGLFMQLVKVEKGFSERLGVKYFLVLDTEGLRTPERSVSEQYNFDNELATLAMCLGDLTLLNTEGEFMNPQMVDILEITMHALIRMKEVSLSSHCYIIQQKVSDVTAEVRNKGTMQEICDALNKATEAAAKAENVMQYKNFSQVFEFHPVEDVLYIPNLWSDSMSAPNHVYSETVRQLKSKMFSAIQKEEIEIQFSISTFTERLNIIYQSIKTEHFVFKFKSTMNVLSYSKFLYSYNKWIASMRNDMLEWELAATSYTDDADFKNRLSLRLKTQKQNVSTKIDKYILENDTISGDIRKLEEMFKTDLEKTIHDIQKTMVEFYRAKKLEKEQVSNVSKFVDSWRIRFRELSQQTLPTAILRRKLTNTEMRSSFCNVWDAWKKEVLSDYQERSLKEKDISDFCRSSLADVLRDTPNNTAYERCNIPFDSLVEFPQNISKYASVGPQFFGETGDNAIVSKLKEKVKKVLSKAELQEVGPFNRNIVKLTLQIALIEIEESNEIRLEREGIVQIMKHICVLLSKILLDKQKSYEKQHSVENILSNVHEECYKEFLSFFENDQQSGTAANLLYAHLLKTSSGIIKREINSIILREMRKRDHFINKQMLIKAILDDIGREKSVKSIIEFLSGMSEYVKRWLEKATTNLCMKPSYVKGQAWIENQLLRVISEINGHIRGLISPPDHSNKFVYRKWLTNFFSSLHDLTQHFWDYDSSLKSLPNVNMQDFFSQLEQKMDRFEYDALCSQIGSNVKAEQLKIFLSNLPKPPYQELFDQISGCWKQCMFCGAVCHIQNKGHKEHSAILHHSQALVGFRYIDSQELVSDLCTTLVASNKTYRFGDNEELRPYKNYKNEFKDWEITPKHDEEPAMFWKWIMAKFNDEIAEHFKVKPAFLPQGWSSISEEEAFQSLNKSYDLL